MAHKSNTCRKAGCTNSPHLGGLCQIHYDEDETAKAIRASALVALHSGVIDGEAPTNRSLSDELKRLRERWNRICQVLHEKRGTDLMPLDEAECATDWCITLAKEIVEADRALATAKPLPTSLAHEGQ